jgi:hypothetical protein
MDETIEELTPYMTGEYIVTTFNGTQHYWNLDEMTYKRIHTSGNNPMDYDGVLVQLTSVELWPKVGASSWIWYDDPNDPVHIEQYRVSSTIQSIEKIEKAETHG